LSWLCPAMGWSCPLDTRDDGTFNDRRMTMLELRPNCECCDKDLICRKTDKISVTGVDTWFTNCRTQSQGSSEFCL